MNLRKARNKMKVTMVITGLLYGSSFKIYWGSFKNYLPAFVFIFYLTEFSIFHSSCM